MGSGRACPAAGVGLCLQNLRVSWAEAAPYPMEDGCTGPFIVQVHTRAEKCNPQRGLEDHFPTGQGSFHCKQLCFIFASINCCSSGFILVSECNQGLINHSAQPKIAAGSCWELGIPSPPVCAEQEGISSAPARCQPCAETAVGCWGDVSPDTFIWKNYCGCLQTSLHCASWPGISQSPGWGK